MAKSIAFFLRNKWLFPFFTQKDKKNRILRVDSQKIIVFLQNI